MYFLPFRVEPEQPPKAMPARGRSHSSSTSASGHYKNLLSTIKAVTVERLLFALASQFNWSIFASVSGITLHCLIPCLIRKKFKICSYCHHHIRNTMKYYIFDCPTTKLLLLLSSIVILFVNYFSLILPRRQSGHVFQKSNSRSRSPGIKEKSFKQFFK